MPWSGGRSVAGLSTFKLLLGQRKLWKTAAETLFCFSRCEASKWSNIGQIWMPISTLGAHSNIRNSQHSHTAICFSLRLLQVPECNTWLWTPSYLNGDLFFLLLVTVTDGQELSKPQLDSLALVNEILLYSGPCFCSDIHKSVVDNWSSYWSTNGHIVSGWF